MPSRHKRARSWLSLSACLLLFACGNAEVDAVKSYKEFLEGASKPLTAMNGARKTLYTIDDPSKMREAFKDKLLPHITELSDQAAKYTPPEVAQLREIHSRLVQVLRDYREATDKLVASLQRAKEQEETDKGAAKSRPSPEQIAAAEAEATAKADRVREKALIDWGEADEKFGTGMQALVQDLEAFLDGLLQR